LKWIDDINESQTEDMTIILVGNKADLIEDRKITFREADELAKQYKFDYIEVSAKSGVNVRFMFEMLSRAMVKKCEEEDSKPKKKKKMKDNLYYKDNSVGIENSITKTKKGFKCCDV
jgi:GTPase SAR1 family protein